MKNIRVCQIFHKNLIKNANSTLTEPLSEDTRKTLQGCGNQNKIAAKIKNVQQKASATVRSDENKVKSETKNFSVNDTSIL